jgi:hypothetical protein
VGRLGGLVPHKYSKGEYYNTRILIMKFSAALTFAVTSGTAVFADGAEAPQYNNNDNNKCKNLLRVSY